MFSNSLSVKDAHQSYKRYWEFFQEQQDKVFKKAQDKYKDGWNAAKNKKNDRKY